MPKDLPPAPAKRRPASPRLTLQRVGRAVSLGDGSAAVSSGSSGVAAVRSNGPSEFPARNASRSEYERLAATELEAADRVSEIELRLLERLGDATRIREDIVLLAGSAHAAGRPVAKTVRAARARLAASGAPAELLDQLAERGRALFERASATLAHVAQAQGGKPLAGLDLASVAELRGAIRRLAHRVNPAAEVAFVTELFGEGSAMLASGAPDTARRKVSGLFDGAKNLVTISLDPTQIDPVATAHHELMHSLEIALQRIAKTS